MRTERLARALRRSGTTTIDDAVDVVADTGGDGEVGGGMVSEVCYFVAGGCWWWLLVLFWVKQMSDA